MSTSKPLSIIIPVYNAASTLPDLFATLEKQTSKELVEEIVFIEDKSTDNSRQLLSDYSKTASYKVSVIHHKSNKGLAKNYNEGIDHIHTPLFILMHDDIQITTTNAFKKTVGLFRKNQNLFCAFPHSSLPLKLFLKYNFWQKILFSRHVGKEITYFCGKFDCYNRKIFIEKIKTFNSDIFRSAGEDADIINRIKKNKLITMASPIRLIHLHNYDSRFSPSMVFHKEAQIAEGQGANLRLNKPENITTFLLTFFRPIIVISLFIPHIQILAITATIVYSLSYTKLVYQHEWKNPRIVILPFFNILLLFVGAFYACKGYISGKQNL